MRQELQENIKVYNEIQESLKPGTWVLIFDRKLISTFESFDQAAREAVRKFGSGPYLIRQVGANPVVLPASVVYRIKPNA